MSRNPDYFITNEGLPNILINRNNNNNKCKNVTLKKIKVNNLKKSEVSTTATTATTTTTTIATTTNNINKTTIIKPRITNINKITTSTKNKLYNNNNNLNDINYQKQQKEQHQQHFDDDKNCNKKLLKCLFNENIKKQNNSESKICKLKSLDNRQTYQKKYDKTIFGKSNQIETNEIVLPPLDI